MDRAKKEELLETCSKKYRVIDVSKKKQILENRRKKYKEMDALKRNKCLVEKLKSLEREKYQNCILRSHVPLGPGKFHVVVLV